MEAAELLDFPPGVAERLKDRSTPIWLTEGVKKVDAGFCAGLAIVGLTGVWNWLKDGAALPDFRDLALKDREVILGFDSDLIIKDGVWKAVRDLGEWLKISRHADVKYCLLPHEGDGKTGLDDYLAAGHTVEELWNTGPTRPAAGRRRHPRATLPFPQNPPQHRNTPGQVAYPPLRCCAASWTGSPTRCAPAAWSARSGSRRRCT